MRSYIARQPIFNIKGKVVAYELLFRDGFQSEFNFSDENEATSQVIVNGLTLFGMEVLTGGLVAFINMTKKILIDDYIRILPPEQVVPEILEDVPADKSVIEACQRLKKAGYKLAMDDVIAGENRFPLVELASIIKVDFLDTTRAEQTQLAAGYTGQKKTLLAEKVETHEDYEFARKNGYTLFQGYFFAKPQILSKGTIPISKLNSLKLLTLLQQDHVELSKLETIIECDSNLSIRLLQYVNSTFFGWRVEIRSVKQAIVLLGQKEFNRWGSVVALSLMADHKPEHLLITGLIRARFLEQMAPSFKMTARVDELFFLGLFSVLDALMDCGFSEIFGLMTVPEAVSKALLGENTDFAKLLTATKCFERGDWDGFFGVTQKFEFSDEDVPEIYLAAVEWAHKTLPKFSFNSSKGV